MSDYSTRNIIDYAMDGDAVKFREELYGAIHDKVTAHIEAAKKSVAQNLIKQEEIQNEEFELEELIEMKGMMHDPRMLKSAQKMKEVKASKHKMAHAFYSNMVAAMKDKNGPDHKSIDKYHKALKSMSEEVEE